jgi:hypothetical protein
MPLTSSRLYFLDWLRVLAFGLLVFYHAGLIFVDWGYHISNRELSEGLKFPLLFLNQWRLPLLFFISGVGIRFALGKRSRGAFIRERFVRLLIPLVFGMLVIVPPQSYYELKNNAVIYENFFHFYVEYYFPEHLTWNHLWFIVYLLAFVLLTFPAFYYLRNDRRFIEWFERAFSGSASLLFLALPLFAIEVWLRDKWPDNRNLVTDWYNFSFYLVIFCYGYIIAMTRATWEAIDRDRFVYLALALLSFGMIYFGWHAPGYNFLETIPGGHYLFDAFKCLDILCTILACMGFGRHYLNYGSPVLDYTNKAVYPFYILHQTVLIVVGYYVILTNWSITAKYLFIVVATFFVSGLIYEFLIRRWKMLRVLFGVK